MCNSITRSIDYRRGMLGASVRSCDDSYNSSSRVPGPRSRDDDLPCTLDALISDTSATFTTERRGAGCVHALLPCPVGD